MSFKEWLNKVWIEYKTRKKQERKLYKEAYHEENKKQIVIRAKADAKSGGSFGRMLDNLNKPQGSKSTKSSKKEDKIDFSDIL